MTAQLDEGAPVVWPTDDGPVPLAPVRVSTHRLSFAAEGSGWAPFTWGQRAVLRDLRRMPEASAYNNVLPVLLPPGCELSAVLAALLAVVERHEALRSVAGAELAHLDGLTVVPNGEVQVEVWYLDGDDHDLAAAAAQAGRRLERRAFDHQREVPLRAAVCVANGMPRGVIVSIAHLAADFQSTRLVADQVVRAASGRIESAAAAQTLPPTPRQVAMHECSAPGLRDGAAALEYLRREMLAFPAAGALPVCRDAEHPRYWRGALTSTRLSAALGAIATRQRTSTQTVALAAVGALLATLGRQDTAGLMLIVGNRARSGRRFAVGTLTQDVPVRVGVNQLESMAEVIKATWSASIRAYKHGGYHPDHGWAVVEEVMRERGEEPELRYFLNDMRRCDPPLALDAVDRGESAFSWEEMHDADDVLVFVELSDVLLDPEAVKLSLLADTAVLSPEWIERFLRATERLILAMATRSVDVAELPGFLGLTA